jgi:hypothetical protein
VCIRALFSRFALVSSCFALAAVVSGCFGGEPPSSGQQATPRPEDPELVHSWQMPAEASVLWSGDLGSKPPALADALMASSAAPSFTHRSATACAQQGLLTGTASMALRLTIAEGGAVTSLEGDPAGPAATCLVDAIRAELAKLPPLPAGAALMLLRFHPTAPK